MARSRLQTILFTVISLMIGAPAPETPAAEPVRLIFDTDICGDCDDVLALGMIHALESRGLCRLLAVTISVDHELAAPFSTRSTRFMNVVTYRSALSARAA